jgi:hypothetical protein
MLVIVEAKWWQKWTDYSGFSLSNIATGVNIFQD